MALAGRPIITAITRDHERRMTLPIAPVAMLLHAPPGEDPMPTSRKHADPKKQTPSSPDAPGERPGPARPSQSGYGHDSRAATREEGRRRPTTPHKSRDPKRPL